MDDSKMPLGILLCGPMTGDLKADWQLFHNYEDKLRQMGLPALNTIELIMMTWKSHPDLKPPADSLISSNSWELLCNLRFCLDALVFCNAIYFIPGWESCGISVIIALAGQALGLKSFSHVNGKLALHENLSWTMETIQGDKVSGLPTNDLEPEDVSEKDWHRMLAEIPEEAGGKRVENPEVKAATDSPSDPLGDWFREQMRKKI